MKFAGGRTRQLDQLHDRAECVERDMARERRLAVIFVYEDGLDHTGG